MTDIKLPKSIIVMGVSGCGKTTIGKYLADAIGGYFLEGDDFHPRSNIEKMSKGIPLTEKDRLPWIDEITIAASEHTTNSTVISCSALSKPIRQRLRAGLIDPILFLHLVVSFDELARRLEARKQHFMPVALLQSQFDALEDPQGAIAIDANGSILTVCKKALSCVRNYEWVC